MQAEAPTLHKETPDKRPSKPKAKAPSRSNVRRS
jgi:hypothetical protein